MNCYLSLLLVSGMAKKLASDFAKIADPKQKDAARKNLADYFITTRDR